MWRVSQKIHRGSLAFFGKWDKINRIRGDATAPEVRRPAESPSHGFAVPAPLGKGAEGTGVRIATASVRTGFAMTHCMKCDTSLGGRPQGSPLQSVTRSAMGGPMWASAPTKMLQVVWCKSGRRDYKRCGKTGRRGNRRSAASGGRSEPISRKCPDWRPQQWPGIGWHDGGQPPAPTGGLKEVCGAGDREGRPYGRQQGVRCGEESPSHGFAVPAPFRQGGRGGREKTEAF